ncbi:MAG: hypothetical protein ACREK2_08555 [Gemmatimonadota bacterium]
MARSRILARAVLLAAAPLLSLAAVPAAGQETPHPPSLLAWMGLETGDTMAFEASDGGQVCVTVGAPRRIGGRAFAPLSGLAWPGFASDSRVLVPLDGALGFFVDWTPGPRPTADAFLPSEGWSRTDPDWSAAEKLVYRSCALCVDAGTTVILERGGGIRSIFRQTIVGPTSLTRIEGGCAEREEVQLEVYVDPAPARDP